MTLTDQEWEQVEHLVNGEYMTQVQDAEFEVALAGVNLALTILKASPIQIELRQQALDFLFTYGLYDEDPIKSILTKEDLHALHVKASGSEEEAVAQERFDALQSMLKPVTSDHVRVWHQDQQKIWHLLESSKEGDRWRYYYDEGRSRSYLVIRGNTDYLYNWYLGDLLRQVKSEKQFDVYEVPIDQWTFSPNVKE